MQTVKNMQLTLSINSPCTHKTIIHPLLCSKLKVFYIGAHCNSISITSFGSPRSSSLAHFLELSSSLAVNQCHTQSHLSQIFVLPIEPKPLLLTCETTYISTNSVTTATAHVYTHA